MKSFASKKNVAAVILIFLLGALSAAAFIFYSAGGLMILENQSGYGFEETTKIFQKEVESAGWSVVGYQNMQEILRGHGHDVKEIKIYELCSAKYSALILKEDDERIVSPLMPCRVAIYKKSDGNTYIARLNSLLMAKPFGGLIDRVMQEAGKQVEGIIGRIIK